VGEGIRRAPEFAPLALSKLAAGRRKDLEFLTEALRANLVDAGRLTRGIELMPEADREPTRVRLEHVLVRNARSTG
jgi:hypothetical protein